MLPQLIKMLKIILFGAVDMITMRFSELGIKQIIYIGFLLRKGELYGESLLICHRTTENIHPDDGSRSSPRPLFDCCLRICHFLLDSGIITTTLANVTKDGLRDWRDRKPFDNRIYQERREALNCLLRSISQHQTKYLKE